MNISRLIDIAVKVWPPKVVVIVNLFGEVNMPKDEPVDASITPAQAAELRHKLSGS